MMCYLFFYQYLKIKIKKTSQILKIKNLFLVRINSTLLYLSLRDLDKNSTLIFKKMQVIMKND